MRDAPHVRAYKLPVRKPPLSRHWPPIWTCSYWQCEPVDRTAVGDIASGRWLTAAPASSAKKPAGCRSPIATTAIAATAGGGNSTAPLQLELVVEQLVELQFEFFVQFELEQFLQLVLELEFEFLFQLVRRRLTSIGSSLGAPEPACRVLLTRSPVRRGCPGRKLGNVDELVWQTSCWTADDLQPLPPASRRCG